MNIQGFETISKIAEGARASVWKAKQLSLDRVVAIKILNSTMADDLAGRQSFISEARTAAQLKNSNIVQVYDVGDQDGRFYFVMEYVEGQSMAERIAKDGAIPVKEALTIALAVPAALSSAFNDAGLLHRNISPENIMIDAEGTVKIVNLGLSTKAPITAGVEKPVVSGSPNYMSPEQISGETELSIASDMYSLGCTLYHMVTGVLPFGDQEQSDIPEMHLNGQLENPRKIKPAIPVGVGQLLSRLTMKNPADRYPSWATASEEIKKVAGGRILLQKKSVTGVSTVKANAPSTKKRVAAKKTFKAAKPAKNSVPMSIQIPAWAVLFIWWIILGYIRCPEDTTPPPVKATPVQTRVVEKKRPTPKKKRTAKKRTSKPKSKAKKTASEILAEIEKPNIEVATADQTLTSVLVAISHMIYTDDFQTASGVVRNEMEYMHPYDVLEKLEKLVAVVDRMEPHMTLVEKGFKKKIGKKVDIVYNGVSRNVKIEAVSNGKVVVSMPSSGGRSGKKTSFELSKLDPAECSRWIETSSKPEINAIKHILYMKALDYENAEKYAKKSGPLSAYFSEQVKSKTQQ